MKIIDTFVAKNGKKIDIILPEISLVQELTDFVNKLSSEDTYLSFAGEKYSVEMERNWLENALTEIKFKKNYIIWAMFDGKIIGNCDVKVGRSREQHTGMIGLMVDKDFRGQGLGEYLLKKIIDQAKKMDLKIVCLTVFSDNLPARKLYEKVGMVEHGKLPNGLFRKGKYSDKIEMSKELI